MVVDPPRSSRAAVGIAEEMAPMVRLWYQLTMDHTPNSEGCCRRCTEGGTGEQHLGRVQSGGWQNSPGKSTSAGCRRTTSAERSLRRHCRPRTVGPALAGSLCPPPNPGEPPDGGECPGRVLEVVRAGIPVVPDAGAVPSALRAVAHRAVVTSSPGNGNGIDRLADRVDLPDAEAGAPVLRVAARTHGSLWGGLVAQQVVQPQSRWNRTSWPSWPPTPSMSW